MQPGGVASPGDHSPVDSSGRFSSCLLPSKTFEAAFNFRLQRHPAVARDADV